MGEQELLAIVHVLKIWRCYLEGVDFTVVTDHTPSTYLPTMPNLSRRYLSWSEYFIVSPSLGNIGEVVLIVLTLCLSQPDRAARQWVGTTYSTRAILPNEGETLKALGLTSLTA